MQYKIPLEGPWRPLANGHNSPTKGYYLTKECNKWIDIVKSDESPGELKVMLSSVFSESKKVNEVCLDTTAWVNLTFLFPALHEYFAEIDPPYAFKRHLNKQVFVRSCKHKWSEGRMICFVGQRMEHKIYIKKKTLETLASLSHWVNVNLGLALDHCYAQHHQAIQTIPCNVFSPVLHPIQTIPSNVLSQVPHPTQTIPSNVPSRVPHSMQTIPSNVPQPIQKIPSNVPSRVPQPNQKNTSSVLSRVPVQKAIAIQISGSGNSSDDYCEE